MRKTSSSNFANQQFLYHECELNYALGIISGRWKAQILMDIAKGTRRFSTLKDGIPHISDQALGRQLRELEKDGLIHREEISAVPKHVEYQLTDKAVPLCLQLKKLCDWAKIYRPTTIPPALSNL